MNKVLNFIDNWGLRFSTLVILIVFLKTCGTNSKIERVNKDVDHLNKRIETLETNLIKEIKIEGLRSEKRMIQSTDRKILDVNRQNEIDKEIDKLNGK